MDDPDILAIYPPTYGYKRGTDDKFICAMIDQSCSDVERTRLFERVLEVERGGDVYECFMDLDQWIEVQIYEGVSE